VEKDRAFSWNYNGPQALPVTGNALLFIQQACSRKELHV